MFIFFQIFIILEPRENMYIWPMQVISKSCSDASINLVYKLYRHNLKLHKIYNTIEIDTYYAFLIIKHFTISAKSNLLFLLFIYLV